MKSVPVNVQCHLCPRYHGTYGPAYEKHWDLMRDRINDKNQKTNKQKIRSLRASWLLKFLTFQSVCYQSDPPCHKISLKVPAWFLDHHIRKSDSCRRIQQQCPRLCSKTESAIKPETEGKPSFPSGHCLQTHECHPSVNSHKLVLFLFLFVCFLFLFFIYLFFICSEFCHTLKWNSHGFTCVPHPDPPSHLPLHPLPLGLPSAPGPSACLMHPTWTGALFHLR